ncbi:MAG TPA: PadR family transcriptional regulator [Actinocrinis sp.]|jgi:DNA-binding PadR family transcriptional regulator
MTGFNEHDAEGPFKGGRRGRGRNRFARPGEEEGERRGRWEHSEPHEGPHEHRGHGHGRRGGPGPWFAGPGPEEWFGGFAGPDFGPGPRFGPGPGGFRGRARSRAGRGDVRTAILALLGDEPRNGYQIIQEIEQRTNGLWRVSSGSVYPALAQLEDEGLIAQSGDGGRKLYTLTDSGRAYAEQHAEQIAGVWDSAVGPGPRIEEMMRHRELIGQLTMAYKQVHQVGSSAQREEARNVLVKARQALYKILAADEADGGEPTDAAPEDQS